MAESTRTVKKASQYLDQLTTKHGVETYILGAVNQEQSQLKTLTLGVMTCRAVFSSFQQICSKHKLSLPNVTVTTKQAMNLSIFIPLKGTEKKKIIQTKFCWDFFMGIVF